ncbi:MAG TPA: 30S ribosomal protein S17 [Candidatus Pacearchaeota archaeon]|nr:30S ribosomal protein S17 [Candidatus Pacearchaeota archaeon]
MAKKGKTKVEAKNLAVAKSMEKIITRGKIFEGVVTKKFQKRVVIEFERMVYIRKYERYAKFKTKIHARLPEEMEKEINLGDLVKVRECRPLSKIIHFAVIQKLKSSNGDTK